MRSGFRTYFYTKMTHHIFLLQEAIWSCVIYLWASTKLWNVFQFGWLCGRAGELCHRASLQVQTGWHEICRCTRILEECFRAWSPPCSPQMHRITTLTFCVRLEALSNQQQVSARLTFWLVGARWVFFWMSLTFMSHLLLLSDCYLM